MKLFIASDLHGSAKFCRMMLEAFERERADKIALLGDILYHGPRNPLPDGYAPQEAAALLNNYRQKIVCVRGNCDSEVDQMVLDFPILSDYALICIDGINMYLSHGHRDTPPMTDSDVYLTGHTHVPLIEKAAGCTLTPAA